MPRSNKEEYDRLRGLINQWNVDHYDIFELSQPNEDLEFHGVVRFFFQGAEGANVVTKCIRVSSTASTKEVIGVLIEKFRPDMRMLSQNKYALYEVHVNGEERRLANDERPLYVQLNWGNDVREGRFLLRNEDHATVRDPALGFDKSVLQQDQPGFKRKLSKREKKEKKRRERERGKENAGAAGAANDEGVASKLYEEAPETSFTRSISNPEAVMRRRRQQKLEKKLAQMNTAEGGNDSAFKILSSILRQKAVCHGCNWPAVVHLNHRPRQLSVVASMSPEGCAQALIIGGPAIYGGVYPPGNTSLFVCSKPESLSEIIGF
ncbi:afadin [Plakobranchus ocellatus]|uniref:Afadin n=1 Tax=Plakobranchus ocellatus TaxID=259542 RepID=A0AAV4CAH3_9GAST|nr:afadin [Plakobranchus ocellatus]